MCSDPNCEANRAAKLAELAQISKDMQSLENVESRKTRIIAVLHGEIARLDARTRSLKLPKYLEAISILYHHCAVIAVEIVVLRHRKYSIESLMAEHILLEHGDEIVSSLGLTETGTGPSVSSADMEAYIRRFDDDPNPDQISVPIFWGPEGSYLNFLRGEEAPETSVPAGGEELKTGAEWELLLADGVSIHDPDGWRKPGRDWFHELISREVFERRFNECTVSLPRDGGSIWRDESTPAQPAAPTFVGTPGSVQRNT